MVVAGVSLTTGIITQLFSGEVSPADSLLTSSTPASPGTTSVAASLPQGLQVSTNTAPLHSPSPTSSTGTPGIAQVATSLPGGLQVSTGAAEAHALSTGGSAGTSSIAPVATSLPGGLQVSTSGAAAHSPLTSDGAEIDPAYGLLLQAAQYSKQNLPDLALAKVNAYIQANPRNPAAYGLRGTLYAEKKLWDKAERDYQSALQFDGGNIPMKFNLAQVEFAKKNYAAARPLFNALEKDQAMGDLATYKVFLCDLSDGHDDVAAKELDAFNQVGSNASYYFANAAWSLSHQKKGDAIQWLTAAKYIYAPAKFKLYVDGIVNLTDAARSTGHATSTPIPSPPLAK